MNTPGAASFPKPAQEHHRLPLRRLRRWRGGMRSTTPASRPTAAAPPRRGDQLRARHVGACRRSRRPQWSCRRTRRAGGGCWATPAASPAVLTPLSSAPLSAASSITPTAGWVRPAWTWGEAAACRGGRAGRPALLARSAQAGAARLPAAPPRARPPVDTRVRAAWAGVHPPPPPPPPHSHGAAPTRRVPRGRLQGAAARGVIANARRLH